MIEAYRIGVNLVMDQTKVTGPLGAVLKSFEAIQQAQRGTQAGLNEFAAGIRAATRATDTLAAAWRKVEEATKAAGRAARSAAPPGANAGGSGPGAPSGGPGASSVMLHAPQIAAGNGGLPAPFFGYPRYGSGGWTGVFIGGGSAAGGASGPQLLLGGGGAGAMPPLFLPPGGMPFSTGGNFSAAMNAISIIDRLVTGIGRLTERAAGFNDALVSLEQRGVSGGRIAGMEDLAFKIAAGVPGAGFKQVVQDAGSLRAVLGDTAGDDPDKVVKAVLPHLEEIFAALVSDGKMPSETARHLMFRAVEMGGGATDPATGKVSPEKFTASMDAVYALLKAAGGVVGERDLLNLSQQGAVIAKQMGDYPAFLRMMIAPLIDMKGSRAGTALQAAGRQLLGGIMSKRTAAEFGDIMGFGTEAFTNGGGGGAILKPELMEKILKDMAGGLQNFIEKDIRPGLIAHGFTTDAQQNEEIFKIAGTDTFRRIMSLFLSNADQVLKDQKLMDNVPGVKAALALQGKEGIGFNMNAMFTSVENFLEALERVNAPAIIGVTQAVKGFFDFLTIGEEFKIKQREDPWKAPPSANPFIGPDRQHYLWNPKAWGFGTDDISEPSKSDGTGKRSGDVYLDGKKVGMILENATADRFSRPITGSNNPDMRVSPLMPGMMGAVGYNVG
jgi:hypothetical protein